jgi:hypothetical protein
MMSREEGEGEGEGEEKTHQLLNDNTNSQMPSYYERDFAVRMHARTQYFKGNAYFIR